MFDKVKGQIVHSVEKHRSGFYDECFLPEFPAFLISTLVSTAAKKVGSFSKPKRLKMLLKHGRFGFQKAHECG